MKIINQLVDFIRHSNDAAEDGDRGRAEDTICLLLFDDGSGRVMIRTGLAGLGRIEIDEHQTLFEFDSVQEIKKRLDEL